MVLWAEPVEQLPFLPRLVVGAAQRDEDVVRSKVPDRIGERRHRGLVADHRAAVSFRCHRLDLAEDDGEPFVGLLTGAVRVRDEPSDPAREDRRHHEELRRALDEHPNEPGKLLDAGRRLPGHDQQAHPVARHVRIMPAIPKSTRGRVGGGLAANAVRVRQLVIGFAAAAGQAARTRSPMPTPTPV